MKNVTSLSTECPEKKSARIEIVNIFLNVEVIIMNIYNMIDW